ncbi:MAG: hypothetical protein SPI30_02320 [Prevotella sp.]|nr:hypothetical protein [Prevotella sp.]
MSSRLSFGFTEGIADYAEEERHRRRRQASESSQAAATSARNVALAVS